MSASVEFREETLEPTDDSAVFKEGPGFGLEFWACGLGCGVWGSGLAEVLGDCRGIFAVYPVAQVLVCQRVYDTHGLILATIHTINSAL